MSLSGVWFVRLGPHQLLPASKRFILIKITCLISETIHTDYKIKLLHLCAGREAVVGFFQGCACERAFKRL